MLYPSPPCFNAIISEERNHTILFTFKYRTQQLYEKIPQLVSSEDNAFLPKCSSQLYGRKFLSRGKLVENGVVNEVNKT